MRKIFVILLFLLSSQVWAQEMRNIYDEAPAKISKRLSFQREKWFYEQRIFPTGKFPMNAYENAFNMKRHLQSSKGFYSGNGNWINLGPTPGVNFYYSNVSSRVATVKFNPVNPEIIYLGAANGGVWKSTNGGYNWVAKSDFEVSLSSGALAIDNVNPDIIYYGTGEATYFTYSYYGRGLLKSTDGGETWINYKAGLPDMTYFSRIVIKPGESNILFAALGNAGLYKSSDAGQTWAQVLTGRCDDIIFSPNGERAYCIGSGTNFRISSDGGLTFNVNSIMTMGSRNHIALCKSVPNILYASLYSGTSVNVYKSIDSGITFNLLQNNFTGTNQGWYDFYIHVNPFDPDNAYVGLVDLWRTTNGSTFTKITNSSSGPVHVDQHNMDFSPTEPDKIIISNDGGVWLSTNRGTNWVNLNSTLTLTQFYRITSEPMNASHLIGGTQDNGVQQTSGSPVWNVLIFGGDGGDAAFDSRNMNYILTENQFNHLWRTTNGGLNWSNDTNGLNGSAAWIAPIVAHPDSSGVFFTARQKVFKTYDYGRNWSAISSGTSGIINELAVSSSNPNTLFASVNNLIYVSVNGGKTFSNVSGNLPSRVITSISVHPDSSKVAVITMSGFGGGHIYKTTDLGNTWINISGDLPDVPVNCGLIYYPGFSTGIILAATDVGVYITNNYGKGWSELATGLPNTVAMHLDYNLLQNKIRVATHGRGIWEFSGNLIGIVNQDSYIPDRYFLSQNYPNPFNPTTKIEVSIPKQGYTSLIVYDILGRQVATLINSALSAGRYEVMFEAGGLKSGIYFYVLRSDAYTESRKMLLIK